MNARELTDKNRDQNNKNKDIFVKLKQKLGNFVVYTIINQNAVD